MPQLVTLDSSVIIAAFRRSEANHADCKRLLESVNKGEFIAVEPYTVLIEIASAIRRRTGLQKLSEKFVQDIRSMSSMFFLDLDANRANQAVNISQSCSVRGMDAVVIQIAKEFNAVLISLDIEILERAKEIVQCKIPSAV